MAICTQCTHPVAYLYTLYQSVNNMRLEQCPNCLAFADPYVEHDTLTLLLDLILLKREVFRHLLFNRGCEPRQPGKLEAKSSAKTRRSRLEPWKLVFQLFPTIVSIDAFIRWKDFASTSRISFAQVAIACLLDTLIFHLSVSLTCVLLLRVLGWYSLTFGPANSYQLGTRGQFQPSLVSLTLFYSSLTKLFLLMLLAIWQSPSTAASMNLVAIGAGLPQFMHHPLIHQMLSLLDEDCFDRAWVIRNVLGGMSAGFGLRVLLDCHPVLTTLVVLSGWLTKSLASQSIALYTGIDNVLEYSIP